MSASLAQQILAAASFEQGRLAERADILAQLRASVVGAQGIAERNDKAGAEPGIDISLYVARLDALIGTFEAGCHEGLGDEA